MKKILALTFACSVLAGCTYLGEPEAYTVVEENTAPVAAAPAPVRAPVVAPAPAVVGNPCGGVYCAAARPVVRPTCACQGACQTNPGIAGPLVVEVPAQPIVIQ